MNQLHENVQEALPDAKTEALHWNQFTTKRLLVAMLATSITIPAYWGLERTSHALEARKHWNAAQDGDNDIEDIRHMRIELTEANLGLGWIGTSEEKVLMRKADFFQEQYDELSSRASYRGQAYVLHKYDESRQKALSELSKLRSSQQKQNRRKDHSHGTQGRRVLYSRA